ncbi:TPA: holin [Kluyvera intermedia]|uniref:Holin n=2 Tax=Enterobacteriaceae TaxID=543 RepID=A0AAC8QLE5_9ENTR|nr:HP1 family phage holin [Phytobacter ursingii]AUU87738.1 holin [Enterobacteriaceae bacterium ENNIH3]AUV06968.1 holin [Enterobacteriaceae bacterium ENNIH2]HAT2207376.1 holin [Kluyvera intermedia]AKL10783.1 holin [Phytobacter ursingii]HAT2518656.1 holin [Kluyvera intermedia]
MGLSMEKITSSLAYWISVALTFFGAMTPQDFAAYFGALGVVLTVGVNWYYRRKSYALLALQLKQSRLTGEAMSNVINR